MVRQRHVVPESQVRTKDRIGERGRRLRQLVIERTLQVGQDWHVLENSHQEVRFARTRKRGKLLSGQS